MAFGRSVIIELFHCYPVAVVLLSLKKLMTRMLGHTRSKRIQKKVIVATITNALKLNNF